MSIIAELSKKDIKIIKTNLFYRGYYNTPKGIMIVKHGEHGRKYEDKCEKKVYLLKTLHKCAERLIFCDSGSIYIISGTKYENSNLTKKEADKLVEIGEIYSFKAKDLYKEYYEMENDPELESCFLYGYSTKTREYIERTMKEIGMINWTEAMYGEKGTPTKFDILKTYSYLEGIEIGKLEGEKWIAQVEHQCSYDDFNVIKMYFDHNPTEYDLQVAYTIRAFTYNPIEIYEELGTGNYVNWLDLDGDIIEKYNKMKKIIQYDCE